MKSEVNSPPRYVEYPRDPRLKPLGRADRLELLRKGYRAWDVVWLTGMGLNAVSSVVRISFADWDKGISVGLVCAYLLFVTCLDARSYTLLVRAFGREIALAALLTILSCALRLALLVAPFPRGFELIIPSVILLLLLWAQRGICKQKFRDLGIHQFWDVHDKMLPSAIEEIRVREAEDQALGVIP